jgi:predicted NBD/HSP70 family sugar kinase
VGEVFALIRSGTADTRSQVGRATGLSRTAVAARLSVLLESGLVVESAEAAESSAGAAAGSTGRPPVRLLFNRDAGVVLAAAIGRSRTQLAVCDLDGTVLAAVDLDQEVGLGPGELMPRVVDGLDGLLSEAGRVPGQVLATGLSLPGTVDFDRGVCLDSPIMAGWDGAPLAPYLAGLADAPVFVDNDANVMALSERRGHLERYDDLLLVKASTGIGAGIVSRGELLRGSLGAAGEIGHTKSPAAAGVPCRCGDTGCVEAVAGGWALAQTLRERGRSVDHIRGVVALALDGDPDARHLVRDSGRRIGEALGAAVNLLNPEAVVIGGDIAPAYDVFAAGLRETLYAAGSALATRELAIVPTTHGDRSGVVGCAAMALGEVLSAGALDARLAAGLS